MAVAEPEGFRLETASGGRHCLAWLVYTLYYLVSMYDDSTRIGTSGVATICQGVDLEYDNIVDVEAISLSYSEGAISTLGDTLPRPR